MRTRLRTGMTEAVDKLPLQIVLNALIYDGLDYTVKD